MASLYRPTVITYCLKDGSYRTPDGARVTKRTPGARKRKYKSKKWYGRYTEGNGRPMRVPLSAVKETARRMLAKLAGDAQLAGVGISDQFADYRAMPLTEHLEDFRRYLLAKGSVPAYVAKTIAQCRAVIDGCDFQTIDDLQPSAVMEFLADLRARGPEATLPSDLEELTSRELAALLDLRQESISRMVRRGQLAVATKGRGRKGSRFSRDDVLIMLAGRRSVGLRTLNHYVAAIKHFSKWLKKPGKRAPSHLLEDLSRYNAATDTRHERRALSSPDFGQLIDAARNGSKFRGLAGDDRAMIYILAAYSGLRCSELASLKPSSFALATKPPTVTVQAAHSKHRRRDIVTLRPDVAKLLDSYLSGRPRDKRLWPGSWTMAAAEMIRIDLQAAGLPYIDDLGRFYDFHALRHQFISNLARAGVHPKMAQQLARHSDIRLTMNVYTHLGLHDQVAALDQLPCPPGIATDKRESRRHRRTALSAGQK